MSAALATSSKPLPPTWPDADDKKRVDLVEARHLILDDDHEDLARDYMLEQAGEFKSAVMGRPDISVNPLSSLGHQLTTPGLYGVTPAISHQLAADASILIGPEGQLAKAGWLTKMQRVQYLAVGCGDYLLRLDVPRDLGELAIRLVSPHRVWIQGHPDRPDVPIKLWELRCRWWADQAKHIWTWDQYDLGETRVDENGDRVRVREPSWRCVTTDGNGNEMDVSNVFIGRANGYYGREGDGAYPYLDEAGEPFLPWAIYRAVDSGRPWNHLEKRGAARGALNAAVFATYTGHAARSASGKTALVAGLVPVGVQVNEAPGDTRITNRPRTLDIPPGAIVYHEVETGSQPFVVEIGPGQELDTLDRFTANYELRQAVRAGLNPADVTRQSANPTSGAALAISNSGRREYSRQVEPVFRRVDEQVLWIAAHLLRIAGLGTPPVSGYTIQYHSIPKSADEQSAERDELDWEIGKGFISEIDAYVRRRPGTSREDAGAAIVGARVERLRLDAEATAAAEAAGLVQPKETEAAAGVTIEKVTEIAQLVSSGELPRSSGIGILTSLVGLTPDQADQVLPDDASIAANKAAKAATTIIESPRGVPKTEPDPDDPPKEN